MLLRSSYGKLMTTFQTLINRTALRLSQVHGSGVQVYAEDRIGEMIQHKFDVLFDEAFWDQFTSWYQWTLDGTLGVVTTDLTEILKRLMDIETIFIDGTISKVMKLPSTVNPFTLTGTQAAYYSGHANEAKVFHVWPKASTGVLAVRVRTKPDAFLLTDEVDFDDQCLILGAAYDYAEDDGTNPAATTKFQLMFENRVAQIKEGLVTPVPLDPISYRAQSFTFTELP